MPILHGLLCGAPQAVREKFYVLMMEAAHGRIKAQLFLVLEEIFRTGFISGMETMAFAWETRPEVILKFIQLLMAEQLGCVRPMPTLLLNLPVSLELLMYSENLVIAPFI